MAESFLQLATADRADALNVAAGKSGRPPHLLEKDVWVVWALRTMFEAPFGSHLVFKGGTSLSKAYGAIRRFSEDVDLTYDIRAIASDLVGLGNDEALPPTKSQEKKWTKEIRDRLSAWVRDTALPLVERCLLAERLPATANVDPDDNYGLVISYEHVAEGSGYVKPAVVLEFGARSTGEPCDVIAVRCDAAEYLSELSFPTATPRVMKAERTFWEKATAVHVFCLGGKLRGSRFSRHWYDLVQLNNAGHASSALTRRDIANQVARHKSMFFPEKSGVGEVVDYTKAIAGHLRLVPEGPMLESLADDYQRMLEDGLLLDAPMSFDDIMSACGLLEQWANTALGSP